MISRIVHDRLEYFLPNMISSNQSDFVKGRNITENVLLAQENTIDTSKTGKPVNVVIELYMAKAYNSVDWDFLINMLEKIRFDRLVVDKI